MNMNISFNNREYGILAAALMNRKERILEVREILSKKGDDDALEIYDKELEVLINLEQRLYQEFMEV
jgi:hypothetical protein